MFREKKNIKKNYIERKTPFKNHKKKSRPVLFDPAQHLHWVAVLPHVRRRDFDSAGEQVKDGRVRHNLFLHVVRQVVHVQVQQGNIIMPEKRLGVWQVVVLVAHAGSTRLARDDKQRAVSVQRKLVDFLVDFVFLFSFLFLGFVFCLGLF